MEDGITLSVVSGFRADDDIDTREAASECGEIGLVKQGQRSLWEGRAKPGDTKCGDIEPPTCPPGGTDGAHRGGYGVDLAVGAGAGYTKDSSGNYIGNAHPEPHAIYKWLLDNAHDYGFVRTVSSERWHWEYKGESGNRYGWWGSDHWSWDNHFTSGEGTV